MTSKNSNNIKNLSVVIPTLQKNKELLTNLVSILEKDNSVTEIIVIDNSCTCFDCDSKKLRVIVPNENLYVNPSWNLGVKEAKEDIVALLNDDITIPNNFCSNVINKMQPNMGCIGLNTDYVKETQDILSAPEIGNVELQEIPNRCLHWGIAIFFIKSAYSIIPEDLKIFYGDDWLIYQNKKQHKKIYNIVGQTIYHYGSLSSNAKSLNPIADNDKKLYIRLTKKWWQFFFNCEPVFRGIKLTIFGIKISYHYSKKH